MTTTKNPTTTAAGGRTPMKTNHNPAARDAAPATDPLAATEATLAQFARTRTVLADTHGAIPSLLAERRRLASELGAAELNGGANADKLRARLDEVESERESAVRQRHSGVELLLSQEAEVKARHTEVMDCLTRHRLEAVQEFRARYDAAVRALQTQIGRASCRERV